MSRRLFIHQTKEGDCPTGNFAIFESLLYLIGEFCARNLEASIPKLFYVRSCGGGILQELERKNVGRSKGLIKNRKLKQIEEAGLTISGMPAARFACFHFGKICELKNPAVIRSCKHGICKKNVAAIAERPCL